MRFLRQILLSSLILLGWGARGQVATADLAATNEGQPVTFNVTNNDIDLDGTIDPATVDLDIGTPGIQPAVITGEGNFSVNSIGDVTYLPAVGFSGVAMLSYYVNDNDGNTTLLPGPIAVTVNANVAPVASDDSESTDEDVPVTVDVVSNDSDAGGFIDPATVDLNTSSPGRQDVNTTGAGDWSVSPAGEVTFTPNGDYNGPATLTYTVDDNLGETSNVATISITIDPVNDAPAITGQTPASLALTEDTPFTVQLSHVVIDDPDNSTFTLTVLSGTNYTFTGNAVTPAADYTGPLTINVKVNDGTVDSPSRGLVAQVSAVNDAPEITGQTPNPINASEDTPFPIALGNLIIDDPDNTTFVLTVLAGTNYTFSGNTVTPASNYSGPLTVNVKVSDGAADSPSFPVAVQVAGSNDVPAITGQTPNPVPATEDTPFTVQLSNLVISDSDNSTFTLTVLAGTNYTFSGNAVTPSSNYNGPLTVNVKVNDGTADSPSFGLAVQVAATNDAPSITGQTPNPINGTQNVAFTVQLSNLIISDIDNSIFTLTVLSGTNYTFSGNAVTPALNYNGPLTVNVKVNDGTSDSPSFPLAVQLASVNVAPSITGQTPNPVPATEDTQFTVQLSNLVISDPDDATFTLTVLAGTNYTFSGNNVTPSSNYTGPLTVNVKVNDGTVDSPNFGLAVQVAAQNDAPAITNQTPSPVNGTEDTQFTVQLSNLVISDPDNTTFTLTVLAGTNYTFSGNTVTPTLNYSGPLTVNVKVNDGTVDSPSFPLAVQLAAANDAPSITGQNPNPIAASEDTPFNIQTSQLIISDPDNTVFTLTILAGTNYTFSGNTVTPASNYTGPLTVNVRVNDGTANSTTFGVAVQVGGVNDSPSITGQTPNPINATEDIAFTLQVSNLIISDLDNTTFNLTVLSGTNYTFSGNTVTPTLNYNGPLTVNVKVNDGTSDSPNFGVAVQVAAVNDAPTIVNQKPLSTGDGQPITLKLTDLTVTDPDDSYPTGFDLSILSGSNYTVSGLTITPSVGFSGNLPVRIFVNDGNANSPIYTLIIAVNYTNKAPTITDQVDLSTNEDTPITLKVENLTINDPDNTYPGDFTLTVQAGTNYTFVGNVVTPASNFTGPLTVKVTVSDGSLSSPVYNVLVTVNPVNDAPTITAQTPNPIAATEDTQFTLQLSNLTITDPDNTSGFTLTVLAGTNYTFSGNNITPAADYAGPLTVNVKVNDGTADSPTRGIAVQVAPVNDAPVVTAQMPNPIVGTQNVAFTLQLSNVVIDDPDNTTGFTLTVLAGTNYTFVGNTVTPALNFNGVLTVNVKVRDAAGLDGPNYGVVVNLGAVNVAPAITGQTPNPVPMTEGQSLTIQLSHLTIMDPDDNTFTLTVLTGTNYTLSGSTITPTANFSGNLTVNVRVSDGTASSPTYGLLVNVAPVNDPPSFADIPDQRVLRNSALKTITITGITPGPLESENLLLTATSANTGLIPNPVIGYNGTAATATLQFQPVANQVGSTVVTVKLVDTGLNEITQTFTIDVVDVRFTSSPVLVAVEGEPYEYNITITDVSDNLSIIASAKPAWATLTALPAPPKNRARLAGTPPVGAPASSVVTLQVKDGATVLDQQQYTLVVNHRPVVSPFGFTMNEDAVHHFEAQEFQNVYTDPDTQPLAEIQFMTLPKHGNLRINSTPVTEDTKIPLASLGNLQYQPLQDYSGQDTLYWKASDGLSYSLNSTYIYLEIVPTNDPPLITALETDSLKYAIGGEVPAQLTSLFTVVDSDDDSLVSAEIGFRSQNFTSLNDRLIFVNTTNITGTYNSSAGTLVLTGKAPIQEYVDAIRSIQYNFVDLIDISLVTKTVYITLSDGKNLSDTKNRYVTLIYEFEELDIPNAFTPNGDGSNDFWKITAEKGMEQYNDAEIRVYNKRGTLIFKAKGFESTWDGTLAGEALPVDTYYYTIDLKYNKITYRGAVVILR